MLLNFDILSLIFFFFSSRRRHTRLTCDWSSDVCSSDLGVGRSLTGEFDVLGTPDYMAPEQALGKTASVDHRGDQYALAVIAFEMLCGQTPFSGTSIMEV